MYGVNLRKCTLCIQHKKTRGGKQKTVSYPGVTVHDLKF